MKLKGRKRMSDTLTGSVDTEVPPRGELVDPHSKPLVYMNFKILRGQRASEPIVGHRLPLDYIS